ncbi:MAG: Bax inhibitor-1 family protein, partial [Myxococcota bacterium]
GVSETPAIFNIIAGNQLVLFVLFAAELGMVFAFSSMVSRVSFNTAAAMFLGYSFLNGLTMSVLFFIYTQQSIFQVFAI